MHKEQAVVSRPRPTTDVHCNPLYTSQKRRDIARQKAVDRVTQLLADQSTDSFSSPSGHSSPGKQLPIKLMDCPLNLNLQACRILIRVVVIVLDKGGMKYIRANRLVLFHEVDI